jgi:hypothetical protein
MGGEKTFEKMVLCFALWFSSVDSVEGPEALRCALSLVGSLCVTCDPGIMVE